MKIKFNFNVPRAPVEKDLLNSKTDEIIDNLFLTTSTNSISYYQKLINNEPDNDGKTIAILNCTLNDFNSTIIGKQASLFNELLAKPETSHLKRISVGDAPGNITINHLKAAYTFIENALQRGEKVIVHCDAGASRSATFVIYYLMKKYRLSFDEAYNHIRNRRPLVNVCNFIPLLKQFNYKELAHSPSLAVKHNQSIPHSNTSFYLNCLLAIGVGVPLTALGVGLLVVCGPGFAVGASVLIGIGGALCLSGLGTSLYQFFTKHDNKAPLINPSIESTSQTIISSCNLFKRD